MESLIKLLEVRDCRCIIVDKDFNVIIDKQANDGEYSPVELACEAFTAEAIEQMDGPFYIYVNYILSYPDVHMLRKYSASFNGYFHYLKVK